MKPPLCGVLVVLAMWNALLSLYEVEAFCGECKCLIEVATSTKTRLKLRFSLRTLIPPNLRNKRKKKSVNFYAEQCSSYTLFDSIATTNVVLVDIRKSIEFLV